jgi:peptidoglycan/LPS O-acetylase OafA/YrhL
LPIKRSIYTKASRDKMSDKIQVQRTASSANDLRNPLLDFTKGILVLFMVLYHWINYFIGPQWAYYRYLRFLTPSFIFITGFMISSIYLSKYYLNDRRLEKRLLTRGTKLIAIFAALNMVRACMLLIFSSDREASNLVDGKQFLAALTTGIFIGKVVAFYILLPIAYLLILSTVLTASQRYFRYTFHVVCGCLFTMVAVLAMSGGKNQNVELVAIGVLGIVSGIKPGVAIQRASRHPYVLIGAYVLYLIAIAKWDVLYPLEVVGTCLSVVLIYVLGASFCSPNRIREEVILLGKYSLFGYIWQIVVLQILHACFKLGSLGTFASLLSFPAAFVLTVVGVEGVHCARMWAARVDRVYKGVFS